MNVCTKAVGMIPVLFCLNTEPLPAMSAPQAQEISDCDKERILETVIMHPSIPINKLVYSDCYQEAYLWWLYVYFFAKEFIVSEGKIVAAVALANCPPLCNESFRSWLIASRGRPLMHNEINRPLCIQYGDIGRIYNANLKDFSGKNILNRRMIRFDSLDDMYASMGNVLNGLPKSARELSKTDESFELPCVQKERTRLLRKSMASFVGKRYSRPFVLLINLGSACEHYDVAIGIYNSTVGDFFVNHLCVFDTQNKISDASYQLITASIHSFLERIRREKTTMLLTPKKVDDDNDDDDDDEQVQAMQSPLTGMSAMDFNVYQEPVFNPDCRVEQPFRVVREDFFARYEHSIAALKALEMRQQEHYGFDWDYCWINDRLALIYAQMVSEAGSVCVADFFIKTAVARGFPELQCRDIVAIQELITLGMSGLRV